ncbi:MAG: DUF6382 domain-containing protein [Lachnospiraceae bacterium]
MEQYTIETQGLNTYRVYQCGKEDLLDTVAIGMMQNNQIAGLLDMQVLRMDDICTLKFNISSKVPLSNFLSGVVKKERFLTVMKKIIDIMRRLEEYLLDVGQVFLTTEDIYVNVSTLEIGMLYYPVLSVKKNLSLNTFFKEILFSTEFDRSENCDYVVSLLNFLNTNKEADATELRKMLEDMLDQGDAKATVIPVQSAASVETPKTIESPSVRPPVLVGETSNVPPVTATTTVPPVQTASQTMASMPAENILPTGQNMNEKKKPVKSAEKEKKGLFGKKISKPTVQPIGIEVPGMTQTTPAKQSTSIEPMQSVTSVQPVSLVQTPVLVQPSMNFGETTVLQTPVIGETTVLGMDMQSNISKPVRAVLERKRTGEVIVIAKDVFKLGKEQHYADYCVLDNSAVSRSHADIVKRDNEYYIVDNNSLNHTFVNGIQIVGQSAQPLKEGDIVTLANEEFIYKLQ